MTKYSKEQLEKAVKKSVSFAGVLRELTLKPSGGHQSHIKRRVIFYEIDYSHFTGQRTNSGENHKGGNEKRTAENVLMRSSKVVREKSNVLRRALMEIGREYKCEECGIGDTYNNKKITLDIDHIDGDWLNNQRENLRFLCPNCHTQTSTFGSKNKTPIEKKVETSPIKVYKKRLKKKHYCYSCNKEICNSSKSCKECHRKDRRVVSRPTKENLEQLIYMLPIIEIAQIYEVTDNTIRKWCKYYNIENPRIPTGFWLRGISPTQRQKS